MLQLYDAAVSPCCIKVRLCLAEKGVPAESVPVNLGTKANLEQDYLALNPKGVVPTLVDDGTVIVESTLINEYLDDKYPSPPLKPGAPAARVEMRKWTKYIDEELHPANGAVVWPILSLERLRQQDPDQVRANLARHPDPKRVARQLQIFDQGYAPRRWERASRCSSRRPRSGRRPSPTASTSRAMHRAWRTSPSCPTPTR